MERLPVLGQIGFVQRTAAKDKVDLKQRLWLEVYPPYASGENLWRWER